MAREITYPPLINWRSLLKGILGGSLFVGGLANNYGLIIQAILVIFGFIILLEGVMVTGKEGVFIVICMLFAVIAGAVTLVLSATGLGTAYLIVVFILSVLLYRGLYMRPMEKVIRKKPHEGTQE